MGIRDWLINRLEKQLKFDFNSIDLETVSEQERERLFILFGEGDQKLTNFLRTTYQHGAPSIYCCSGHTINPSYVMIRVTDDNIDLLRKVGRVISNYKVATNFMDSYITGRTVSFHATELDENEWLKIAADVMEQPELYEDVEPGIMYHEEILYDVKPLSIRIKEKLLAYLKKEQQQLPTAEKSKVIEINETNNTDQKQAWWTLTQAQKEQANTYKLSDINSSTQQQCSKQLKEQQSGDETR